MGHRVHTGAEKPRLHGGDAHFRLASEIGEILARARAGHNERFPTLLAGALVVPRSGV